MLANFRKCIQTFTQQHVFNCVCGIWCNLQLCTLSFSPYLKPSLWRDYLLEKNRNLNRPMTTFYLCSADPFLNLHPIKETSHRNCTHSFDWTEQTGRLQVATRDFIMALSCMVRLSYRLGVQPTVIWVHTQYTLTFKVTLLVRPYIHRPVFLSYFLFRVNSETIRLLRPYFFRPIGCIIIENFL